MYRIQLHQTTESSMAILIILNVAARPNFNSKWQTGTKVDSWLCQPEPLNHDRNDVTSYSILKILTIASKRQAYLLPLPAIKRSTYDNNPNINVTFYGSLIWEYIETSEH